MQLYDEILQYVAALCCIKCLHNNILSYKWIIFWGIKENLYQFFYWFTSLGISISTRLDHLLPSELA